jgi:CheY-like chemotaxis protein/ketosteroid isomerase-like protein
MEARNMSFDPLAAAIDWLHAYRSGDLETIINMYSDDAVIECGCCAMTTVTGKAALRTYWEQRFQDSVPSDLEDLQPSHEGAMITYQARNGTVFADLKFNPDGEIAFLRCGPLLRGMATPLASKRLKVFIVEDETMIRMMVVDMLEELGHMITAQAGQLDHALGLARAAEFDLAILDVNLHGHFITPVAELIEDRGVPIIFATGYGAAGVPEEFQDRPTLQKPFDFRALESAISAVLKSSPGV